MKRDMDIIRRIVLATRDTDGPVARIDGIDAETFAAHVQLLDEAGLVKTSLKGDEKKAADLVILWRLTWAGHDFADAITNETLWQKAKDNVMKPAASWTFGILLEYLKSEIGRNLPTL